MEDEKKYTKNLKITSHVDLDRNALQRLDGHHTSLFTIFSTIAKVQASLLKYN